MPVIEMTDTIDYSPNRRTEKIDNDLLNDTMVISHLSWESLSCSPAEPNRTFNETDAINAVKGSWP